jgi:glycosyltransferase involved in cell wall biosynthesis
MIMKPTIAYVIDTLCRGGAERVVLNLANSIDPNRFRVLLATTRKPGEFASDLLPHIEQIHLNRTGRFDIHALRMLAKIFDENGVLLVHSHNHSSSYLCRIVRALSRRKWLHVVHDHHGPATDSHKMDLLDRVFLRNVDCYVAVSDALRQRAVKTIGLRPDKVVYVPNGVKLPKLVERPSADPLTVIQSARVVELKNLELAVEAAHQLNLAGIPFCWLVAGKTADADLFARLQSSIDGYGLGSKFIFLGERADISELLNTAHVGVLTSRYEGLSMAVLEYMAHGLPVVLTDVGHSSEIVRAAGGGQVVAQGDGISLARAISALAQSQAVRAYYGRLNLEYVASNYSDHAMAQRIMDLYDEVLSHAH